MTRTQNDAQNKNNNIHYDTQKHIHTHLKLHALHALHALRSDSNKRLLKSFPMSILKGIRYKTATPFKQLCVHNFSVQCLSRRF